MDCAGYLVPCANPCGGVVELGQTSNRRSRDLFWPSAGSSRSSPASRTISGLGRNGDAAAAKDGRAARHEHSQYRLTATARSVRPVFSTFLSRRQACEHQSAPRSIAHSCFSAAGAAGGAALLRLVNFQNALARLKREWALRARSSNFWICAC